MLFEAGTSGTYTLIPEGRALLEALGGQFQLFLSSTDHKRDEVERQLGLLNIGVGSYVRLLTGSRDVASLEMRCQHLLEVRSLGNRIAFFIDSDPEVAAFAVDHGVTPLCCPHPYFGEWSLRSDAEQVQPQWEDLVNATLRDRAGWVRDDRRWKAEVYDDDRQEM